MQVQPQILHICTWGGFVKMQGWPDIYVYVYTNNIGPSRYIAYLHLGGLCGIWGSMWICEFVIFSSVQHFWLMFLGIHVHELVNSSQ